MPKGKVTLAGALRENGLGLGGADEDEGSDGERSDGEEERRRGGRKGKVGIRDGLFSGTRDDDEWD